MGNFDSVQLCSITLVTGLLVLFRGATKITHKAQAITCLAAKWHVCATIDSFESNEPESPRIQIPCPRPFPSRASNENDVESDGEDAGDEEDDVDSTKLIPAYASSTISFQKRQALGESHICFSSCTNIFVVDERSLYLLVGI